MDERTVHRAYLSLGSNLEPEKNLPAAIDALAEFGRVATVSQVWESPPVDHSDQPNYLNCAVLFETQIEAKDFYSEVIGVIEQQLNRVRDPNNKNAARTIDIDVSLFNDNILTIGQHQIPDPEILVRPFVTIPLAEVDPDYVHPKNSRTLKEIVEGFDLTDSRMRLRSDIVLWPQRSEE